MVSKKNENKTIEDIEEEKVKIPVWRSFGINVLVFTLPIYLVMLSIYLYFIIMKFLHVDTLFGLTPSHIIFDDFWLWIFSPILIIECYFIYIVSVVYLTYWFHLYFDKKSPPQEGTYVRKYDKNNVIDERIKYYNYRGFIIKFPLWLASKSPFYWMMNWVLRKIGKNNIHKNAHLVESFPPLNFYTAEENTIFYPTAGGSSHMIDSIFGLLSNYKVIMKKGSLQYPHSGMGPDTIIEEGNILMPGTLLPKRWRGKPGVSVHAGIPAMPSRKYQGIGSILEKDSIPDKSSVPEKDDKKDKNDVKTNSNAEINSITDSNKPSAKKQFDPRMLMKQKIPITTSNIYTDKNSLIILIQFFLGMLIMISTNYFYWYYIFSGNYWLLLLLPGSIYMYCLQFPFSVALIASLMVKLLRKKHPPQEGIFSLDSDEFKYYKLRYWASVFPIWLARAVPVPWIDMIVYRMLGVKMGKNVCIYDTWFDIDFVELGDHVMTSLNTSVFSHAIFQDKFIQLKTVMKKNSIAGAIATVAPGTIIDEGAVLASTCSTYIGQHLIGAKNHIGNPVFMTMPIKTNEEIRIENQNIGENK